MTQGIIDVHHHIIPKTYRDALIEAGVDKSGGMPIKQWTPEMSIKMMDDLGIDTGIASISAPALIPLNPDKRKETARKTNEYEAQLIKDYPNRFGALAVLPLPDIDASIDEINYALDTLQLDGIGLLSNYGDKFLGDPEFEPIMKTLDQHHATVLVHPNMSDADVPRPKYLQIDFMAEFTFNTTRAAANLILSGTLDRYPNIQFILVHAGGTLPYLNWRLNQSYAWMRENISDNEIFVDLKKEPKDYIHDFYYDLALSTQPATFEALKTTTDTSHVLYGSDAQYAPKETATRMISDINDYHLYDAQTKTAIMYENAQKLFPRLHQ